MIDALKDRVVAATSSLFSHGDRPLQHTLEYPGDPGLLGPDSVSWRVIGDAAAFVGGIRALIVQTAHPEVVAGVDEHSTYRVDPLGRLTRTSRYVTETTYGAIPEVDAAVAEVRVRHRPVRGRSARGLQYRAGDPVLTAFVHNALTDSFLAAYQAYGPEPLSDEDADRFVAEQTRIGALLGASPMPTTAEGLRTWISEHPGVQCSDAQRRAVAFLRNPPLPVPVRVAYRPLFEAAVATIPTRIQEVTGASSTPLRSSIGGVVVSSLRWALGSSPSWQVALVRAGASVPEGRFRQPLPPEARDLAR